MKKHTLIQLISVVIFFSCSHSHQTINSDSSRAPASAPPEIITDVSDSFYNFPKKIPRAPGVLLKSEPLQNVTLPEGMNGWRIMYSTTINDKTPAIGVATIFVPKKISDRPYPVITWAHASMGIQQRCMPSLMSKPSEGIPALKEIVEAGWVIVVPDYAFAKKNGALPFFIGEGEARASLDAVRAARSTDGLRLESRTVIWGHSQGGHAALWTGIIAEKYAPEIDLMGVAAIAPAVDIEKIILSNEKVNKRLGPYLATSYSQYYPEIKFEKAIRPEALKAAREIADLCAYVPPEEPKRIAELVTTFNGPSLSKDKKLQKRIKENDVNKKITTPVLIAHGLEDNIISPEIIEDFYAEKCKEDQQLEYWTFEGLDHQSIVKAESKLEEPLIIWTKERLENKPVEDACRRTSF